MSEEYKKFGELSRAEQVELVEHVLDGGEVEIFSNTSWHNTEMVKTGVLYFYDEYCYRKLKSELDLLKEQRDELDEKIKKFEGGISVGDIVINKLDASKKEYKVIKYAFNEYDFIIGGNIYSKAQVKDRFIKVK